jgi:G:T-mismatch repair DNA endonuclease (very short patch repair protein)
LGWKALILWECEVQNEQFVMKELRSFLDSEA